MLGSSQACLSRRAFAIQSRWYASADFDQIASMLSGNGIKRLLIQKGWALSSHFEFVSVECWILLFSRLFTCHSGCQRLKGVDATRAVAPGRRNYTLWQKPSNPPPDPISWYGHEEVEVAALNVFTVANGAEYPDVHETVGLDSLLDLLETLRQS